MSVRIDVFSRAAAVLTMVALLAGCINGATVRTGSKDTGGGGGGGTPTPAPTSSASPSGSATPSVSGSVALDSGKTNIFDVTSDDTFVYYTVQVSNNGFLYAVPKSSTGTAVPIKLADSGFVNRPWGVACDPGTTGYVYVVDNLTSNQGKLYRVPKPVGGAAAGNPELICGNMQAPTFVRIQGSSVQGGASLYVSENIPSGRIYRFNNTFGSSASLNQDANQKAFIVFGAQSTPPYNMHLFPVKAGTATSPSTYLFFTRMDGGLLSATQNAVCYVNTQNQPPQGGYPESSQFVVTVATGLIFPTDVWLHQRGSELEVMWPEFSQTLGGVRKAKFTDTAVRGTSIGIGNGSVSTLPPTSLRVDETTGVAYVSRNAQQVNGGGFVTINLATDVATALTFSNNGSVSGGVNFPWQCIGEPGFGLVATEFQLGQPSTQPSSLVRLVTNVDFSPPVQSDGNYYVSP